MIVINTKKQVFKFAASFFTSFMIFAFTTNLSQATEKTVESIKFPALNPEIKLGAKYDSKIMPVLKSKVSWLKVPSWFVGTWHTDEYTLYEAEDVNSGRKECINQKLPAQADQTFGMQVFKGEYWHAFVFPYKVELEDKNDKLIQLTWKAPAEVSKDKITITFISTKILVDKKSNKISEIINSLSTQTYKSLKPDIILVDFIQDRIDRSIGHHRTRQRAELKKVQPFMAFDELQGQDIKSDFMNFRSAH